MLKSTATSSTFAAVAVAAVATFQAHRVTRMARASAIRAHAGSIARPHRAPRQRSASPAASLHWLSADTGTFAPAARPRLELQAS